MRTQNVLYAVAEQWRLVFAPVETALADPVNFTQLLQRHGWQAAPETFDLTALRQRFALSDLLADVERLLAQTLSADAQTLLELYPRIFALLGQLRERVQALADTVPSPELPFPLHEAAFWAEFPNALWNDLLVTYFKDHQPLLFAVLHLCGIVEESAVDVQGATGRLNYTKRTFDLTQLEKLFTPLALMHTVYQWDDATNPFDHLKFLERLQAVFEALGFTAALYPPDPDLLTAYYSPNHALRNEVRELRVSLVEDSAETEADRFVLLFSVLPIPLTADGTGAPVGLSLGPIVKGPLPTTTNLGLRQLVLTGEFTSPQGLRLEIRPGQVTARAAGVTTVNAALELLVTPETPLLLIGEALSDHLQVASYGARLQLTGPVENVQFALAIVLGQSELNFDLGAAFGASLAIESGWEQASLSFGSGATFDFQHLRLVTALAPAFRLDMDIRIRYHHGGWRVERTPAARAWALPAAPATATRNLFLPNPFTLYEPDLPNLLPEDLYISRTCFAITWQDPNLKRWLNGLVADFFDTQPANGTNTVTLQLIFGRPLRELRLDWQIAATHKPIYRLPGLVKMAMPDAGTLSLIFGAGGQPLTKMAVALTLKQGASLTAYSDLAWERNGERELQNDATEKPPAPPPTPADPSLFVAALQVRAALPNQQTQTTLVLAEFDLALSQLPQFLRQPEVALQPLNVNDPDTLCQPVAALKRLNADSWTGNVQFNLDALDALQLPMLKQTTAKQFIEIHPIGQPDLDLVQLRAAMTIGVTINLGDLEVAGQFDVGFNLETFALALHHGQGTQLLVTEPELTRNFLGLTWKLRGKPLKTESGAATGVYHLFTFVTDKYNYQIKQAEDAVIELFYDGISEDRLGFSVSNFLINDKGLSLDSTVIDEPVRLRGIDTRFRFTGSGISLRNNEIQAVTLHGSGALPPDLVGDSKVDIDLQFGRRADNTFTLLQGEAHLQGDKLLKCQGTRFQFAINDIGLKFVNDGKFHLYFTLTGSAQFVLGPGDDKEGALALLPKLKIDLVECPLTGDASVLAKHIKFLVELPKPISFNFLGCFEMELRGIGFVPQADVFGGDGAMELTGQLKFAQGAGDTADPRTDYHILYIGLPKAGDIFPRIYFKRLAVSLGLGAAFKVQGVVDFTDEENEKGFRGEGALELQGMPSFAASFAFLRVRRDPNSVWLRAWFIYLEVRRMSIPIPILKIYLREVGFGFGYRYTIASIKAADNTSDIRVLLKELKALAITQGDLAKFDRWAVDLEEPGQDPRWTVVLRAMLSENSAAPSPLSWNEQAEKGISCLFLFDAIIAFRSDFTFFMSVRGWLNTNYAAYVNDDPPKGIRQAPLFAGFVLLHPRRKRFLANLSTNPDGKVGENPNWSDFVRKAIESVEFSATLLIEPGLLHYELGWPNMLRWEGDLGPLKVQIRGGFIFRISRDELLIGSSLMARGSLKIEGGVDLGVVGVDIRAYAEVAYGARYIGVLAFRDTGARSAFYGAIGLEIHVEIEIRFWIDLFLFSLDVTFSVGISFTAALEVGILGDDPPGLRGRATIALKAMGRSIRFAINIDVHGAAVTEALRRVEPFLHVGLEATEVDTLPGLGPAAGARALGVAGERFVARALAEPTARSVSALLPTPLTTPDYTLFVVRVSEQECFFLLLPAGERRVTAADGQLQYAAETRFLPTPPADPPPLGLIDFLLKFPQSPATDFTLSQFVPGENGWQDRTAAVRTGATLDWRADWTAPVFVDKSASAQKPTLAALLRAAFVNHATGLTDPEPLAVNGALEDDRVHNPSDNSFEAAVRGAVEQFQGSPFFKHDPTLAYDRALAEAFGQRRTGTDAAAVYQPSAVGADEKEQQGADQIRSVILQELINDVRRYAADPTSVKVEAAPAFQLGLVFRVEGKRPAWLDAILADDRDLPQISQREGTGQLTPPPLETLSAPPRVRPFNPPMTSFAANPPRFDRVRHYTNARAVGITWQLIWDQAPSAQCTPHQADPEHHLLHYHVQRRALNSQERAVTFTVKSADVLHRAKNEQGDSLQSLRPRFQFVDYFTQETEAELATLPPTGRSYLYTITPVDFAENRGRPLTIIATRYPDEPPQVPADGELTILYRLAPSLVFIDPVASDQPVAPSVVKPAALEVRWTQPTPPKTGPAIGIAGYRLIFRREETLPIGSYGLDSVTAREQVKSLPSSNARLRPTDIVVEIGEDAVQGRGRQRSAAIPVLTLQEKGILPTDSDPVWRPQAWRLFLQTRSVQNVLSALAPVQLTLRLLGEVTADAALEERRVAELEWLPHQLRLPVLPPHDTKATIGYVHVPMPALNQWRFQGGLEEVHYQPHPAGIRSIRLRWNQAPSGAPHYPLALNAGYELLELDADDVTAETMGDPAKLAAVLRQLQEVQMLPAADLALTPSDTLNTNQWEAWYPSTSQRREERRQAVVARKLRQGSQTVLSSWYSWRESYLEWPTWPPEENANEGALLLHLHPLLRALVNALTSKEVGDDKFAVDLQAFPPLQPISFADFRRSTAPTTDPYGWGLLQRLGLSITFTLRDPDTGAVIPGPSALTALHTLLNDAASPLQAHLASLRAFLHVELLFQPSKSIRLQTGTVDANQLLALVQVSLRPQPQQQLHYTQVRLRGLAGTKLLLVLSLADAACSFIHHTASKRTGANQQQQVELTQEADKPLVVPITIPPSGESVILLRSPRTFALGVGDGNRLRVAMPVQASQIDGLPSSVQHLAEAKVLVFNESPAVLNTTKPADIVLIRSKLTTEEQKTLDAFLQLDTVGANAFAPTDDFASYFLVPVEGWAKEFSHEPSAAGQQWVALKTLLERLNSSGRQAVAPADEPRIELPTAEKALLEANLLAETLIWTQRFFDHSAPIGLPPAEAGPWLVTAYPRITSPAYATPDEAGRLEYYHLIEDKWAHIYRYYVRPYGRYDRLWSNIRQSSRIWQQAGGAAQVVIPDPEQGGLDVVLDRLHPIDMPTILRSQRLDLPAPAGQPSAPGKIWEVIIAQHREQAMSERNQTLARRLDYRHIAYTLLRRFAAQTQWEQWRSAQWAEATGAKPATLEFPYTLAYPERPDANLPTPVTAQDIELPATLSAEELLALSLPTRLDNFQQGALVVQWQDLPFYYEHRLLVIAQTSTLVSPVNTVTQRHFEYRTPAPLNKVYPTGRAAFLEGGDQAGERLVALPLQRLWDSLPEASQQRWPDENPDTTADRTQRPPGALPDAEVVYQIIEYFQGNIEVQAELYVDVQDGEARTGWYRVRPLGKRQEVDESSLTIIPPALPAPGQPLDHHYLQLRLRQLPAAAGPQDWTVSELVSTTVTGVSDAASLTPMDNCTLVWYGTGITPAEELALTTLPGDAAFQRAVTQLLAAINSGINTGDTLPTSVAPLGAEQRPNNLDFGKTWLYEEFQWTGLPNGASLALLTDLSAPTEPRATGVRWTGLLLESDAAAVRSELLKWAQSSELQAALETLWGALETRLLHESYTGARTQEQLPATLRHQLTIANGLLTWQGRVKDADQLTTLTSQADPQITNDPPFSAAVAQLLQRLRAEPITVELTLSLRPIQLPSSLHGKLILGRYRLSVPGALRQATAVTLRQRFAPSGDQPVIERLYERSITQGLRGRELRIRTRRAAAAPSEMFKLEVQPLPPLTPVPTPPSPPESASPSAVAPSGRPTRAARKARGTAKPRKGAQA